MEDFAKTQPNETTTKKEYVEIPSDEPISKEEEDFLNRKSFVELVASLIEANIKPPYSIGIYGDWGSGKTSIMRLIEEKIRNSGNYRVIWFDAWEYENETNLIYPLVRLIQNEIISDKLDQIKETTTKLTSVILKTACDAFLGRLTEGTVSIEKIRKHWDEYVEKHTSTFNNWIDEISKVKEEFKKLTEAACEPSEGEKEKKCIIVFIDDLDRCLPENSIKILESIKNIFSQGKCIFILGVDKKTIARVIKGRYPSLTEAECNEYLTKIIPFGFDVPECQVVDFDNYLKSLIFDKLKIKFTTGATKMHPTDIVKIDLAEISAVCVDSRLHNPRKIKRSLIAFYSYYKIRQSGGFDSHLVNDIMRTNVNYQDVLMFCLFYEFWNDFFEKTLISNHLLTTATAEATSKRFIDWQRTFSDGMTHPILKSVASDENLYHFLRLWTSPQDPNFVNVLIRASRLMGLRKR